MTTTPMPSPDMVLTDVGLPFGPASEWAGDADIWIQSTGCAFLLSFRIAGTDRTFSRAWFISNFGCEFALEADREMTRFLDAYAQYCPDEYEAGRVNSDLRRRCPDWTEPMATYHPEAAE